MSEIVDHRGLVGREPERARLLELLDRATAGSCVVAMLVGEAGIGKSRLADEVVDEARRRDVRVLRGGSEAGGSSPFALWDGVVRRFDAVPIADPALPASDRRWELLEGLVISLSAAAPVVVVLEDLHWADDASRWVLDRLPRELGRAGVLLVLTTRDERLEALDAIRRQAEVVALGGLDLAATEQLAADLGAAGIDAAALLERSGGVPLFVRELVTMRGPDDRLPPVVGDLLATSLQRLSAATADAVWALAVAGETAPVGLLGAALDRDPLEVRGALDEAVATEVLIDEDAAAPQFRHALLRDAALALHPPAERRRLHDRLAAAWATRPPTLENRAAAARHRLDAVPVGSALDAAAAARSVATELRIAQPGRAVALLERAVAVMEASDPGAADQLAPLLVDLAEARWSVGELPEAIAAFERAAAAAVELDDPAILAAAEIGAARSLNMFLPDPDRVRRLIRAEARLPPGDRSDRVRLLGRRALKQMPEPDDVRGAIAVAEDAVQMARRIGQPELLVDALCDRHQVMIEPEAIAARSAAVDEMLALARQQGRNDLALRGYEWRACEQLEVGAGDAARRTIERLDALAALMPAPTWRYTSLLRLRTLLYLEGDRAAAEEVGDAALALGARTATEVERIGVDVGGRISAADLWGRTDPELVERNLRANQAFSGLPKPFFQVRVASAERFGGRPEAAERILRRAAPEPARLLLASEGMSTLNLAAVLVADLGLVDLAAATYDALAPYRGRLGSGNGIGFTVPVDATLGRLALLLGRDAEGIAHLRAGVAFGERFPSPPLEARCRLLLADALAAIGDPAADGERTRAVHQADAIGMVVMTGGNRPAATATPVGARSASLRRDGARWRVESPMGAAEVAHSRGLEQLARVLVAGGRELSAVDLASSGDAPPPAADLGPALDGRAKQQYRRRIEELEAEIDEAERFHDPVRADRATAEMEVVLAELRRAVGLHGRDRPSGSGTERARVNVTRSIKRAIAAIGEAAPDLGAHLAVSVRTGRSCSYQPEPATSLRWSIGA